MLTKFLLLGHQRDPLIASFQLMCNSHMFVRTRTPIRHSESLHNPVAYPTPQSLPRARNSPRPTSISPPQTPMTRSHSSSILEEGQSPDNDEADNSVSYEGEMALVVTILSLFPNAGALICDFDRSKLAITWTGRISVMLQRFRRLYKKGMMF